MQRYPKPESEPESESEKSEMDEDEKLDAEVKNKPKANNEGAVTDNSLFSLIFSSPLCTRPCWPRKGGRRRGLMRKRHR